MPDHEFEKSKNYNYKRGCPDGYHKRASYKSSTGEFVPARCVRSTTKYKDSSAEYRRKKELRQTRRLRMHIPSIRSLTRKNCPPGFIPRKAYVRKYTSAIRARGYTVRKSGGKTYRIYPKSKGMYVQSQCIKDLGLPGKGPKSGKGIGPLRKGELAKYGYSYKGSQSQRHAALKKAAEAYGALGVYRKLDAVAKLTMRTLPDVAATFKADKAWVKKNLGPLKAF